MNKTAIKNFAIWARVQLIEAAKQRAYEYEITENGENKAGLDMVGGRLLTKTEKEQRNQLISEINRKGFSQVMEEAAYTWFNRFIALRFMEVNGYLPSKVRVFTDEIGAFKPEILKQAMSVELDGLDRNKVLDLLDRQDNEELFKYLLITQCNALNVGLSYMFEKIANWTELLFPTNLLRSDSVVARMVSEIPEEDWTDAVQIIGWMYQYYNSEPKSLAFAKEGKISKEDIPAVTQLFTPDWIVRYMVENSLGRLWYEGHSDFDKSQWKYYLDEAEQEPEVEAQLQKIRIEYAAIRPEEIKVIDPCMGSGHILVYAFDVLMQIYTSAGWSERDAAKSILENNLYGLDIDDRAGQLAYFAVMMKARKHSRRILNGDVKPNVFSIHDSNWMTDDFITYVAGKDATMKADLVMLRKTFRDAKEYGSILNVPAMHYDALYERIDIISRSYADDLFQALYHTMAVEHLLPLVKQSQIMTQKYDVVVTNPPYMGLKKMTAPVAEFVMNHYASAKQDLATVFILKSMNMIRQNGYIALITQHGWMFQTSYEQLREYILSYLLVNMIHLGAGAFEEISGEVVQTTSFVVRKTAIKNHNSVVVRLIDNADKEEGFLYKRHERIVNPEKLYNIPGKVFAYWLTDTVINAFRSNSISSYAANFQGIIPGKADYLKLWHEIQFNRIRFQDNDPSVLESMDAFYPYAKGGAFRRWYGNNSYVLQWRKNGSDFIRSRTDNRDLFFKGGITWSDISTGLYCARQFNDCQLFDAAGPVIIPYHKDSACYLLGFMNTVVFQSLIDIVCQGLHYGNGAVISRPVIIQENDRSMINSLTTDNISYSKQDWDSFETSWDFKKHPLI